MEKRIIAMPKGNTLSLLDLRDGRSILNGGDLSLSYTKQDEDITKGERQNGCSPYDSHEAELRLDTKRGILLDFKMGDAREWGPTRPRRAFNEMQRIRA